MGRTRRSLERPFSIHNLSSGTFEETEIGEDTPVTGLC